MGGGREGCQGTFLLDPQAREKLQWWISNMKLVNGSAICPAMTEMMIISDASKMGWSATSRNLPLHQCLGTESYFFSPTDFPETPLECIGETPPRQHNSGCLYKQPRGYMLTQSVSLTLDLWKWYLQRNILISAEYLPGISNVQVDKESRTFLDLSDWRLHPQLKQPFLKDREIDLFALRLTHQLHTYARGYLLCFLGVWPSGGKISDPGNGFPAI